MQVLKTTIKLRPAVNPYSETEFFSAWVLSRNSIIIDSSPAFKRFRGAFIGDVINWTTWRGGHWSSQFVEAHT